MDSSARPFSVVSGACPLRTPLQIPLQALLRTRQKPNPLCPLNKSVPFPPTACLFYPRVSIYDKNVIEVTDTYQQPIVQSRLAYGSSQIPSHSQRRNQKCIGGLQSKGPVIGVRLLVSLTVFVNRRPTTYRVRQSHLPLSTVRDWLLWSVFPPPQHFICRICRLRPTVLLAECILSQCGLNESFVASPARDCIVDRDLAGTAVLFFRNGSFCRGG